MSSCIHPSATLSAIFFDMIIIVLTILPKTPDNNGSRNWNANELIKQIIIQTFRNNLERKVKQI